MKRTVNSHDIRYINKILHDRKSVGYFPVCAYSGGRTTEIFYFNMKKTWSKPECLAGPHMANLQKCDQGSVAASIIRIFH